MGCGLWEEKPVRSRKLILVWEPDQPSTPFFIYDPLEHRENISRAFGTSARPPLASFQPLRKTQHPDPNCPTITISPFCASLTESFTVPQGCFTNDATSRLTFLRSHSFDAMILQKYSRFVDGTIPVAALLYDDEENYASQDGVGIYDG